MVASLRAPFAAADPTLPFAAADPPGHP